MTDAERVMSRFLEGYSSEKLRLVGEHIADAFLHGFVSQFRERGGRGGVRLFYRLGQEAIADCVCSALHRRGLRPVRMPAKGMLTAPSGIPQTEEAYAGWLKERAGELKTICGTISIDHFGSPAGFERGDAALESVKRRLESQYLPPSTQSYCKVAFPNPLIGECFEELFDKFVEINTTRPEPYERAQQAIIDALDECHSVRIVGREGNRTDLTAALNTLADSDQHTNFLNCGGDLNIPHGEVFTTPKLSGTHGRLHVGEICLRGIRYEELRLDFEDGRLVAFSCGNGGSKYVQETLLDGRPSLPIGELAIGTNTRLGAVAERYRLGSVLPILLMEKTGPHIALGDPCFARAEDAPVYNLRAGEAAARGKEMTARENEITARRKTDAAVYMDAHIDITLPLRDTALLCGVSSGGEIKIIENGRFVLPGTELLWPDGETGGAYDE